MNNIAYYLSIACDQNGAIWNENRFHSIGKGSRSCGPCPPGYRGDGFYCSFVGACSVNNGGCHPAAICYDNPGTSLNESVLLCYVIAIIYVLLTFVVQWRMMECSNFEFLRFVPVPARIHGQRLRSAGLRRIGRRDPSAGCVHAQSVPVWRRVFR